MEKNMLFNRGKSQIINLIKKRVKILYPPVTQNEIDVNEKELGFSMPPLLKQLYLEVGNGGFGPGYGILGLEGGHTTYNGDSCLKLQRILSLPDPEDPFWSWPKGLLPFCDWGCNIYSCVSCTKKDFPIKWFDPNGHNPNSNWDDSFIDHLPSFKDWIILWLNGENHFISLQKIKY